MKQFLVFCLCLFVACGGDTTTDQGETTAALQVFHYNQPSAITSLDPAFARSQNNIWAVDHLYNGLVQLDDQLNIVPAIAERWEISEDGLVYTFTLRKDVSFHDNACFSEGKGRVVQAEDFKYSFERILAEETGSPGAWIFKDRVQATNAFEVTGPHEFKIHLQKAFRPMLGILTMQYCSVVPKEAIVKYGNDFRSNPVGTGAFQLKRWLENQALFLVKNPNYFEKENGQALPYLDGVKISFIGDRKTAYLELLKGKLDYISGLEASYVNDLLTKDGALQSKQAENLQFLKSPYLNTEYFGIYMKSTDKMNPLAQKQIRQALNYGIDRAQMMEAMRNNVGKAAVAGFTPRGLPSFSATQTKGYSYQPDRARDLLKKAGFPNGKNLPEIKLLTNKDYLDLCTFAAKQWEELGIKVQIELMESATLREMMSKGQANFFRASWIADYPDAESFFTMFYSKYPAPPNYTQFANANFDKLYEAALNENDDAKRYALYQSMDNILIEEAPVVFLFYDETAVFARKNIKGLSKNAVNLLSLKKVRKE
ncbi:MAG: ABC transporter substrate-binding protein [Saprospiraceae bacterium]